MLQILLLGLVVVGAYLVAHYSVMAIESWWGKPLGAWRSVWFFCIFLVLALGAFEIVPRYFGPAGATLP